MKNQSKRIFYIILTLFIISLIPLYIIGIYAHPSVDDYYYGVETAQVWNNTHSIFEVIKTSFNEMIRTYHDWQGNFSAIFLMRLQPGIFGENYYFITPLILITAYVASSVFFFYTMLSVFFKAEKYKAGIISICITFVSMQLTNTPSDAFYWFNGSIYYTGFYCMMLVLFAVMARIWNLMNSNCFSRSNSNSTKNSSLNLKTNLSDTKANSQSSEITYEKNNKNSKKEACNISKNVTAKVIILEIISLPLAFFIGGSNFATALFTVIILVLICVVLTYLIIKEKKEHISFLHLLCFSLIAAACLAGLLVSMLAPGNSIRQASVGGSTGLIKTFIYTFAYGGYSLADVLSAPCLVFFVILIPALYSIVKKTGFSYKYPLFVMIFTFGLYCSAGTPVFYAQGLRIPYRLMNIIYFSAYSFICFNLMYFLGWINRNYGNTAIVKNLEGFFGKIKTDSKRLFVSLFVCLFVFLVTCIGLIEVTESEYGNGNASFSNMTMSMAATYSLVSGDARNYDEELDARVEYLLTTDEKHVELKLLSVYPEPIFHTEITEDATHWKNAHLALFYGKEAIWLEK